MRFAQLEAKPPWSDEWATIVYSLGHTFATVPLDRIISLDALLQPLQLDSMQGTGAVIHYLMRDSTHPPLYFVLSHWWIKLLSPQEGLISIGIARSLSALLGATAIPAMFWLGWIGFRSRLVGQMAAALMAVSPYGIYLAQEARHYTLAILLAIASLGCLVVAVRYVNEKTPPPTWVILVWVGVNSLGMATHYFFSLALAAQFLVLLSVWVVDKRWFYAGWIRIYGAIVGTLAGVFVWFPALRRIPGNDLTDWIYDNPLGDLAPIGQLLAWLITMPFMLPVEGTSLPITVLSGLAIVIFLIWLLPSVVRSLPLSLSVQVLCGYAIASLALVLGVTYLFGADLTVAARFQFNYFPAILLLLGVSLASLWQKVELPPSAFGNCFRARGKTAVIVALMMGLLGGLTVVSNFGYQKFERPDLLIPVIVEAQIRTEPILIATTYQSYGQTAEMIGLAWQFGQLQRTKRSNYLTSPQFLLAHRDDSQHATQVLQQAIGQTPLQLWLVNFSAPVELDAQCSPDSQFEGKVPGYRYRLYRCMSSVE